MLPFRRQFLAVYGAAYLALAASSPLGGYWPRLWPLAVWSATLAATGAAVLVLAATGAGRILSAWLITFAGAAQTLGLSARALDGGLTAGIVSRFALWAALTAGALALVVLDP